MNTEVSLTKNQMVGIPILVIISASFGFTLFLHQIDAESNQKTATDLKNHESLPAHPGAQTTIDNVERKVDALYCKEKRMIDNQDYRDCFLK